MVFQNDIITFTVDHRGSGQFGMKGMDYLYRNLGKWEILDYEDAVKWLRTKPYVDSTRIGITGTSYGGYMTCLALTKGAGYWTHGLQECRLPITGFMIIYILNGIWILQRIILKVTRMVRL